MKKLEHIGRYSVNRTLGRGGMGTVYLCHDPELERPVAVKLLHQRSRELEPEALRRRFLHETLCTARLQHPGIPPVYTMETTPEGRYFYTMKPIEGRSLQSILDDMRADRGGPREQYDVYSMVQILHEVCQTIRYAHNQGFIHRDLKPANIFVGDYGDVYILDWGLAKFIREENPLTDIVRSKAEASSPALTVDDSAETIAIQATPLAADYETHGPAPSDPGPDQPLTMHGDVLGTPAYMPPEQVSGRIEELGKESDIYALGVILYEVLTLELPYQSTDLREILTLKEDAAAMPPEQKAPRRNIPPELSAITMQAMSASPDERFKSVAELDRALTFFLEGKTLFRNAFKQILDTKSTMPVPRRHRRAWLLHGDSLATTDRVPEGKNAYLLLAREFPGDIRFSAAVEADPIHTDTGITISEFALVLNAAVPSTYQGFLDGYTIHLGAANNSRAYLARHDSEIASNEHVVLEPRRRYRLSVERSGHSIRVMLDRQVILFCTDRDPVDGLRVGFLHRGPGILYSNIRVQTRGLPTLISSIEVPEALMAQGCYEAALDRFLALADAHRDRFDGAWARYRAGLAAFRLSQDRKRALRLWAPLRKGHYAAFERLGRAMLELERNRLRTAARIVGEILEETETLKILEPVADIVFTQVQQLLRVEPKGEPSWRNVDSWVRLALRLGQVVEDKRPMTPSVLWRWLLFSLQRFPHHLPQCTGFLRDTFGTGQGAFAQVVTAIEPLMTVLQRSAQMADQPFLVDRIMRLILSHDDNLGNLETLTRFYLHSGHEEVALALCQHIIHLARQHRNRIPVRPLVLLGCLRWLQGDAEGATELYHLMVKEGDEWGRHDGRLLLGLACYDAGKKKQAAKHWRKVRDDENASAYGRHLVASGLLGQMPEDPQHAKLPQRTDHRRLYLLFLGYKAFLDWKQDPAPARKRRAVRLLEAARELIRPTYDIYSATDSLVRLPLAALGCTLEPRPEPEPLSPAEETWLNQLTAAASAERPSEQRAAASRRRRGNRQPGRKSRK